jgi:amino acid permease
MTFTINVTQLLQPVWDLVQNLVDNAGLIITVIIVFAIIYIVKKYASGIGDLFGGLMKGYTKKE